MEKLQLGRKRKTGCRKTPNGPADAGAESPAQRRFPGGHDPEELEHQRRNQEILGRLDRPYGGDGV